MIYTQNLPRIDTLDKLASTVASFPESAYHIADTARYQGYGQEIITFLKLFDPHHMFSSKKEFLTDCEELEILLTEVNKMPDEGYLSAQD